SPASRGLRHFEPPLIGKAADLTKQGLRYWSPAFSSLKVSRPPVLWSGRSVRSSNFYTVQTLSLAFRSDAPPPAPLESLPLVLPTERYFAPYQHRRLPDLRLCRPVSAPPVQAPPFHRPPQ